MIQWRHLLAFVLLLALAGCSSSSTRGPDGPYTGQEAAERNPLEAQRLTQQAADLLATRPDRAEALLREALSADLYHGPAHNNLGVLHLRRGELYEAAAEFEWARRLMPGHPDPRLNLALTLEQAGRIQEAFEAYDTALETRPSHLPTIEALAASQVRHGHMDDRTPGFLDTIALRGNESWRQWAKLQKAILDSRGDESW